MIINTPMVKGGLLALIVLSAGLFTVTKRSAGSMDQIAWGNHVSTFDIIKVEDGIDLFLKQEASYSVDIKANEIHPDMIVTTVEGNTLFIETKGNFHYSGPLEVYVTFPSLSELHASGGSDVYAEEGLDLDAFKLFCSGGSDTKMKLNIGNLHCQTSGGSDAILSGEVQNLDLEASGGSDFNGKDLLVTNAVVRSSGASDVNLYVTGDVDVEASGASDVYLKGEAKVVRSKASGGADIHY